MNLVRIYKKKLVSVSAVVVVVVGWLVNSFLTVTGKFSVMTGTLLCVFSLYQRHSRLES